MVEIEPEPRETSPGARGLTVAFTGGTGFIGRAVVRRLLRAEIAVRALVRPASRASCFEASGLTWIEGDLSSAENLRGLVAGASAVVHCAGSVRGVTMEDFLQANVSGVRNIVRASLETTKPPRFLLFSSLAARAPRLSFYAASKRRGEEVLLDSARDLGWTILRPPAVYGPGDREMLPLLQWLRRGLMFVPGSGEGRFSLIFVSDLAEAVLKWLESDATGCFELHDGKEGGYGWEEIRAMAAELYRRPVRRVDIPRGIVEAAARLNAVAARLAGYRPMLTPGKVRELCHTDWICDNLEFSRATGWRPEVGFREGLRRTLG